MREKLLRGESKLAIVGLGYVGAPLAIAFAKKVSVIGYDVNEEKIRQYQNGHDPTGEIAPGDLETTTIEFTSDQTRLQEAGFIIVAVPTPINRDKSPDLGAVISATQTVGKQLQKGSYVVYESTVYPGVSEDICIPILEKESGLVCGVDFKIGYSPERVNPGDKVHSLENIIKIVSGMDEETLDAVAGVYDLVTKAGVFRASSIRVAEATKLAENAQRDLNIAFMNELAIFLDRIGLETNEVIETMQTKWNALGFFPGLVGGHCIGVDPYYFIFQAETVGYDAQLVLTGRKINDSMGIFVADKAISALISGNKRVKGANVYVFGATFKENVGDVRNSRVKDIIMRLCEYGVNAKLLDPVADEEEIRKTFKRDKAKIEDVKDADCLIFATAHDEYKNLSYEQIDRWFRNSPGEVSSVIDVKRIFDKNRFESMGHIYWGL
ncbi:MAG: nucleotide sugar dehydrogenase [Ruminococcaceae bacterium]|nr:nucleotide sugar dehydrogenase [Oscillospiraceae bacterium]